MFEKKVFMERMRQRRLELGIGVRAMARHLGCAPSLINQYEDGTTLPGVPNLVMLADVLDVSLDWLCGRVDHR